jgi:tetratricopeptide (TPR) repeat protein
MTSARKRLACCLALMLLLGTSAWAEAGAPAPVLPSAPEDQQAEFATARRGLDSLMNGEPDAAIRIFHDIQAKDPESPLGDLLEADALWWKIYYATGNLINPDVFDVVNADTTPYDAQFDGLVSSVIRKAQARIRAGQEAALNELSLGLAYGLRARLTGMRGDDLATARAGKKMRATLLDAIAKDPNLNDAYLGVGIYNYFVDTLPAIVKLIRWFIGLPGGSREEGLRQIERTATRGDLARGEAEFYLAKDYSRPYEHEYQKSLELFQQLAREYPRNGLWKILTGSLEIRFGHTAEGEALYRQVFKETAGEKSEAGRAFHRAAKQALLEQHPDEKFAD